MWYTFRGVTIRRSGRCENCVPISLSGTCKVMLHTSVLVLLGRLVKTSLMPSPHTPPSEKQSGEQSQIPWAYSPEVVGPMRLQDQ